VLHLADKYLFPRVAMLCTQAMEEQVAQDREMALKVLALCHCPESLACKCIDALTPALELHEVYALLHAPTQSENVAAKARTVCSRWLSQHYGESWPEQTPESILDLEFPAFELLLQADDLKVRSENMVYQAVVDWIRHKPCRKQHFDDLWRHVRKYYMTTGFLLEVVSTFPLVSERELLCVIKKRLGSLYRYEWGKPRTYQNPPLYVDFPSLCPGAKWQKKVYCNAVEVTVNIEARTVEHAYEVIVNVGGYAPVLQRELHATVLMQDGKSILCERWIAGSSKAVVPDYQPCKCVALVLEDIDHPEQGFKTQDMDEGLGA